MSGRRGMRPLLVVATAVAVATLVGACSGPDILFYEVLRTREEECAIRQNGEFCVEPEQFEAPVLEVWSVEEHDDRSLLYINEEVWLLEPLPDDADATTPHTATKRQISVVGAGGCTNTSIRSVRFVADNAGFAGTFSSESVLEGPASCGATPSGERFRDDVSGVVSGP